MVNGWRQMTVGLVFAGALVAGTALPAMGAVPAETISHAAVSTIFEGVGVGPNSVLAVRRARADAARQAEAAGFVPTRCTEAPPDVETIRPGQVVAFVDLLC